MNFAEIIPIKEALWPLARIYEYWLFCKSLPNLKAEYMYENLEEHIIKVELISISPSSVINSTSLGARITTSRERAFFDNASSIVSSIPPRFASEIITQMLGFSSMFPFLCLELFW
jgi:hypothetical protein